MAFVMLGGALTGQGRLEEAEPWVQRAERTVRADAEPAVAVRVHHVRGLLELARGRDADALAAFRVAERLAGLLAAPHYLVPAARARQLQALLRLGETEQAEQALADLGEEERDRGEVRIATAVLRLAQGDPARRPRRSRRSWTAPLGEPPDLARSVVPAGSDRPGRAR